MMYFTPSAPSGVHPKVMPIVATNNNVTAPPMAQSFAVFSCGLGNTFRVIHIAAHRVSRQIVPAIADRGKARLWGENTGLFGGGACGGIASR
jgi:hypothetical protein